MACQSGVLPGCVQKVENGHGGIGLFKHYDVIGVRHQFLRARFAALAARKIGVGQAVNLLMDSILQSHRCINVVFRNKNHDIVQIQHKSISFFNFQHTRLRWLRKSHGFELGAHRGSAFVNLVLA